MAEPARRRPKGAAAGNPVIFGAVAMPAKQVVLDTAAALGVAQAVALETILLALELDHDGVPVAIDRNRFDRGEELPIPAA